MSLVTKDDLCTFDVPFHLTDSHLHASHLGTVLVQFKYRGLILSPYIESGLSCCDDQMVGSRAPRESLNGSQVH